MKNDLSEPQRRAVETTEGAELVFAGAGSGKTRVITRRIAYLIDELNVDPKSILAVTFTNKAAEEMYERVKTLLNSYEKFSGLTICTFHALGLKILKREYRKIGYSKNFTLYSAYEQKELIKIVMKEKKISFDRFSPYALLNVVSKLKNDPTLRNNSAFLTANLTNAVAAKLLEPYQAALKAREAVDFDDLITTTVKLLKNDGEILRKYASHYKYIMVDEYQDANDSQFELIKLLSSLNKNLCVVGDDDQSIYGWRGAKVENILNFERDFKNATVIKLEENYRSVREIVEAAGNLIANNSKRADKKCFTSISSGEGEGVQVVENIDENDESAFVADQILRGAKNGEKFSDTAVVVRTNYQTKSFEIAFAKLGIPFVIIGGEKFFENKEIKDVAAYIRILLNPNDEISLRRIINYPPRKIGNVTVERLFETSKSMKISPILLLKDFNIYKPLFTKEQADSLSLFAKTLNFLDGKFASSNPLTFTKELIEEIRLENEIKKNSENENVAKIKLDNISAFFDAIANYPEFPKYRIARPFFAQFIDSTTLLQNGEEKNESNAVSIITAHSAKGLEFEKVFLTGFYQGGFPNHVAIEEFNLEEERRLAYVAFTRAKRLLAITVPKIVSFRGKSRNVEPSCFLKEAKLNKSQIKSIDKLAILQTILEKLKSQK